MKIPKKTLDSLLSQNDSGKAIGNWIVDEPNKIDPACFEKICSKVGWPDGDPQYSYASSVIADEEQTATIKIAVFFSIKYPSCCDDPPHTEPHNGAIEATISLNSGVITFKEM